MDRRDFLKTGLAAVTGLAAGALWTPARAQGRPIVSLVRHTALQDADEQAAAALIRPMVFAAICDAVQLPHIQQAMQKLFKPDDVVGIKLNCIAPQIAPQPAVVNAVVEALTFAGVDPQHVIIYDKEDRDLAAAGYTCTATGAGPMIYGTTGPTKNPGYEERFTEEGKTAFCLSRIVTRECTALINIPVLKHHTFAGITCALKNHFGSIHNPEDFHYLDGCNPAVADVNMATALRTRQRLCLVDAIYLQYDGGPSYSPRHVEFYGAILASTDPVALDTEALIITEMFRKEHGLPPLSEAIRPPKYIATAAEYGLGCGDPQQIALLVRNA
jgi:uncharacterized protein (DUF362 family)